MVISKKAEQILEAIEERIEQAFCDCKVRRQLAGTL
jgi:hypothetical protein